MGDEPALLAIVGDTGPLLCAGGLGYRDGVSMLTRRFAGRFVVPVQVQRELKALERKNDEVGRAAALASGRKAGFVKIDFSRWTEEQQLLAREAVLAAEREREARGGRPAKLSGHGGETDAILLAKKTGAILLTNDLPARTAARTLGVTTASFATVLAAEIADARLDAVRAAELCDSLNPRHFFTGEHRPSAQTLAGLYVPNGL